jgi:thymidylate synthase (FAD)
MKNTVRLLRYAGGDESHAEAAWASTGGMTEEKRSRMPGLIMQLGTSDPRHTVPFEHSWLQFAITCDTASHIQILKHRTLSVNAESARYKEYTADKYYIPEDWSEDAMMELEDDSEMAYVHYHTAVANLQSMLGMTRKRAKESARYFLPYAIQVNLVVSGNFHAYANFWKLRNSDQAQLEIHQISAEMLRLVKETTNDSFRHSLDAWGL